MVVLEEYKAVFALAVDFDFNARLATICHSCSVSRETRVSNETELFAGVGGPSDALSDARGGASAILRSGGALGDCAALSEAP